jgi:hypothetical protein
MTDTHHWIYSMQMKTNWPQMKNTITKSKGNGSKNLYTAETCTTPAKNMSNKWLTSADLFAETEGFLTAIHEQVILRRNYRRYIFKQPNTDELCRRCGKEPETIQRITAACEQLASTEYGKRHDGVAKVIHQKLAEAAELIEDKSPYYRYTPANVLEKDSFRLYLNRSIITDETIPANRPDITLTNKKTKTTYLIDIAVPNTHSCPEHT